MFVFLPSDSGYGGGVRTTFFGLSGAYNTQSCAEEKRAQRCCGEALERNVLPRFGHHVRDPWRLEDFRLYRTEEA